METQVIVRAQAVGGKFLGMAVVPPISPKTPAPALEVFLGELPVAKAVFTAVNSGEIGKTRTYPYTTPITVEAGGGSPIYIPGDYYLAPVTGKDDSLAMVSLQLTDQPVEYAFHVTAYDSDTAPPQTYVHRQALTTATAEVVVPIPGLRITNIAATTGGITVDIAMMCGCKITPLHWNPAPPPPGQKIEPYWPEYQFETQVEWNGSSGQNLTCTGAGTFSTQGISLSPGKYTISVYARQLAPARDTGNQNKVQTTVLVT